MGRRGESIFRRKDGRWEARYSLGKDAATGKTKYRSVYGNTYGEAKERRMQAMRKTYISQKNGGFIEAVRKWLEEKEPGVKEQTYRRYQQSLRETTAAKQSSPNRGLFVCWLSFHNICH